MSGTNEIELKVKESLSELAIEYEWLAVDSDFADTAQFCERYGFRLEESGNTIIVASKRGEKKYSACIVLGTDRLDVNNKVRNLMNVSRLSFASLDETACLTGMMIGGVTPFALPADIPVYVDANVMSLRRIVLGAGSRSGKILIHPQELMKIPSVEIVNGLAITA